MAFVRIVLLFMIAAILYGLVHDQITARVCLEYFTIGHQRMFESDSPTLHALYWGIAATWWAGLAVGILVALASRVGSLPKLTWRQQLKPAAYLIFFMALFAASAGLYEYYDAKGIGRNDFGRLFPGLPVPPEKQAAFMADFAAHNFSYFVGFAGGVMIAFVSIGRRITLRPPARRPPPLSAVTPTH